MSDAKTRAPRCHATMAVELLTPFVRRFHALGPEIERQAMEEGNAIFAAAGLDLEELRALQARIPHDVCMALQESGRHVTGDPANALHAGAGAERGDFGIVEHLLGSAATFRDALTLALHYMPLLYDGARLSLHEDNARVVWRYSMVEGVTTLASNNDYVVAAFVRSAQRQIGYDVPPLEVRFLHERPTYAEQYQTVLRAPVSFGHAHNEIVFPRAALDLPLVHADASLHEILRRYADELLSRLPTHTPFTLRTRAAVRKHLSKGALLADVARSLSSSERSLRRRLADEGTTHSDILDSVRREVAMRMLADPETDVSEIAFALGFAHPTAFNRAFRRWHDMSPREFIARRPRNPFHRFYGPRSDE